MHDIVKLNLDNEMDLILAHKRSMKLAEMCGLASSAQTRFATAVSEVARCSITKGKNSVLTIGINTVRPTQKDVIALLVDSVDLKKDNPEAFAYAARISGKIDYHFDGSQSTTSLTYPIHSPGLISETKIKGFKDYFKREPALSPYDEIRKKNLELIHLSEKLGESELRYRQLADTLPVLISVVDDRSRVVLNNNWLKQSLDKPFESLDRDTLSGFLHPSDVESLAVGWEKAKASLSGYTGQVRIKLADEYLWHLVSIVPNRQEDGSIKNWLIYFVDINAQKVVEETLKNNTELKEIQQQLESMNAQLSFKNRELEQFAFIASHDLQEPLRKIRIMISRAAEGLDAESRQKLYFEKIKGAAERMSKLINDVLDYSRTETHTANFRKVDLNEIVLHTLNDLSFVVEERQAIIHIENLPVIKGLEAQLRQLFYNVISNALKFNEGTPEIAISYSVEDRMSFDEFLNIPGKYHVISIADNGIGMEIEYSDKIFDMFKRLHHRESYEGNGIGLALCKRIMMNHHGAIDFVSHMGKGTTFRLYFPYN